MSRRTPAKAPTIHPARRRRLRGRSGSTVGSTVASVSGTRRTRFEDSRKKNYSAERCGERGSARVYQHDPGSARRRRNRRAHGNVEGAGVVVRAFGSCSFGNLAAGRPADGFAASPPPGVGERKHAMQSAAGRARSGFRRARRRSGGAHVPIASVVLSPPVSSCRRRSGTTALRQALPTRSRPPPRKVTDAAAGAQPQLPASGFIQGEPPGRILERTAPFSWEATEPKSSKDVAPLRHH